METPKGVKQHILRTPECKKIFDQQLQSAGNNSNNSPPASASQARHHESSDYMTEPEGSDEWGLAEWLARSVNKTSTDEFLKLPIVSRL